MPKIIESSEKILEMIDGAPDEGELFCEERYPFRVLSVGQSFIVENKTLGKIEMLAEKAKALYGRQYVVIKREDGTIEVGRINKQEGVPFQIFEASPEGKSRMLSIYDDFGLSEDATLRPWNMLPLGHCFIIRADLSAGRSIRVSAAIQNRKGGKKYSVVHHKHDGIFEIVRIL